jgi:hypothetical protein
MLVLQRRVYYEIQKAKVADAAAIVDSPAATKSNSVSSMVSKSNSSNDNHNKTD